MLSPRCWTRTKEGVGQAFRKQVPIAFKIMFLELTNSNCFKNKKFYDQWFQNHFLNVYSISIRSTTVCLAERTI
jgi:hypothetical protein